MQGVSEAQFSSEQPVKDTDWGFATKLPAVPIPVFETSNRTCQVNNNVHQHESGIWLPERTMLQIQTGCETSAVTAYVQVTLQRCMRAESSTAQTASMPWLKPLELLQLSVTSGSDQA